RAPSARHNRTWECSNVATPRASREGVQRRVWCELLPNTAIASFGRAWIEGAPAALESEATLLSNARRWAAPNNIDVATVLECLYTSARSIDRCCRRTESQLRIRTSS